MALLSGIKNNLEEQLALYSSDTTSKNQEKRPQKQFSLKKPERSSSLPFTPPVKPRLSFSKSTDNSSHSRSFSENTTAQSTPLPRSAPRNVLSLQRAKAFSSPSASPHHHKPSLPVALVTPVVSKAAQSYAAVRPIQSAVKLPPKNPLPPVTPVERSPRLGHIREYSGTGGRNSPNTMRDSQDSVISVSSDEAVFSPKLAVPGSSLAFCRVPPTTASLQPAPKHLQNSEADSRCSLELELRKVQEERLSVMDDICELLADIPSSEMASLFRLSTGHVQKKLAMRKKLLLKEESLKKSIDCCMAGPSVVSSSVSSHAASPPKSSPLPMPPWVVQSNASPSPLTPHLQSSTSSSNAEPSPHHTEAPPPLGPPSSAHIGAPKSLQASSSDYSGYLRASSSAEDLQPVRSEGSRHFVSSSSSHVEGSRPTSSGFTGASRPALLSSADRPLGANTATAPGTRSIVHPEEFEEECEAIAAELDAMGDMDDMDDGEGWDFDTQDMLIGDSEMDLGAPPPQPNHPDGHSTIQPSFQTPHASDDFPVSKASSLSRGSFKPPFLQQDSGQDSGQLNRSFAGASGKPSMFKPSTGKTLPKDDASEFRGQYQHTREMYKIFHQVFGLKKFRPNQLEAVNAAILRKDCFVLMPTGGGKSLCYQLPALMTPGVTVVVSPLRSLMQDQIQKLTSFMIPAKHLSSDLSLTEEREVYDSLSLREPVTKLLYVTPEKLGASNKLVSTLRDLHGRQMLARFVIDEAHCISQWGHDFRPDYKKLSQLRRNYSGVPIMALTATATPRVRADILYQLNMQKTCKWFTQSFNRTNLKYLVVPKKPKKVMQDIIELISKSFPGQSGIVYCLSRRNCEIMAGELCRANIAALCYHAGLSNDERCTVQQRWIQEDRCKVVCATIAFGMGIDKPDVRFVIHHSLPKSVEGYYQEAGRAGRDGLPAQCILFYSYSDMARLRRMVKAEKLRYDQEKVHMDNLYRMVQYCENMSDCRRMQLLEYFAENFDPSLCKGGSTPCDNCQSSAPFTTTDVTDIVKVIVRSVEQIGKDKYTLNQYMEALKGSSGSRISGELRASPLFGRGANQTKHDLERLLHMLVMRDILSESLTIGNHDNVVCYVKTGSNAQDLLDGRITGLILKVKRSGTGASRSDTTTKTLSNEDRLKAECLKALTTLRLSVTTKHNLKNPEYVVPGTALRAMADQLPTTEEELLNLEGYTRVKWERFEGPEFLKVTQEYAEEIARIHTSSSSKKASSGKAAQSAAARKTGSNGKEVTSDYFKENDGNSNNTHPVLGKGKRKKADGTDQTPRPQVKKQALLNFINDIDSEDEFEMPLRTLRPENH